MPHNRCHPAIGRRTRGFLVVLLFCLQGCVAPLHREGVPGCDALALQDGVERQADCRWYPQSLPYKRTARNATQQEQRGAAATLPVSSVVNELGTPPLSPGDRVNVSVLDGEEFSGIFEIDLDGTLQLPYNAPLRLAGLTSRTAARVIARALVEGGFIRAHAVRVSVHVQQWAPVHVSVSGAVFEPGRHRINDRAAEQRIHKSTQLAGDYAPERDLAAALRAAGGIRPDAAVNRVEITRNGQTVRVDLSAILVGGQLEDIPLAAGDQIHVPKTGEFRETLVRPSAITPPGIRVFLSNLTVPATSNASSGVSSDATRLPYGTRLLNAAFSANCVGGAGSTNSRRYVLLVSNNPITGAPEVVDRSVAQLVARPWEPTINPVLMPGDGVACYDSDVTNVREVARTVTDILLPLGILGGL
jgi:protein involved in polysaccharide export with SLBB domain